MIEQFIADFARLIATEPDRIEVDRTDFEPGFSEIVIYASRADVGKIIGKDGNMINSLKTVIGGCKAKNGVSYRVLVKSLEERPK
ncbi:MAG: KH domain-containing protein [Helicobacteraceae bacterium]|jgi:predicted RNA-binding protein YlqC (UPF0109 family)|nr:KH domain-containing protein [Helicobacteraceae bacterium]